MNRIFKTAILAAAIVCVAACGNAGAKNDNKKTAATETSQATVIELTTETSDYTLKTRGKIQKRKTA